MAKIYIGSSLYNAEAVRRVRDYFQSNGHTITYDWTTHGKVTNPSDLRKYGEEELSGVLSCDVFFMMQPARFGTHIELGIALGANKKIVMVVDPDAEVKTFYLLSQVTQFYDLDQAINFVMENYK